MTEKMIRCTCGSVYDVLKIKQCPSCGDSVTLSGRADTGGVLKKMEEDFSETRDSERSEFKGGNNFSKGWKKQAVFVVMLIVCVVLGLRLLSASSHNAAQSQKLAGSTILVDRKLVGGWKIDIPNTQGQSYWMITIKDNGDFKFEAKGPGAPAPYTGKFEAENGRWLLHSTTIQWTDEGTYLLSDPDTFVLKGKLGTGIWKREK